MKKRIRRKVLAAAAILAVLAAGFWAARQVGLFGARAPATMRPWRRPVEPRPLPPKPRAPAPRPEPAPVFGLSKMAIILDDWGMSEALLDDAVALKRPVTIAVLPHLPHSASIAREAARNGLGVMLHMPMQPQGTGQPKEPRTIQVDTSDTRIRRYLDEALASVPGARGVNNHQGSAATGDRRVMKTVLEHLKNKGLFFVDSFVVSSTVGPETAKEVGIPFTRRDAFIDNVAEKQAVKRELEKAIRAAVRRKKSVVIGHDKRPTLEAIAEMIPAIDKAGVRLVLVEELVA